MKKFLSLTLIFVLCLALAACTQDDTPQTGLSDETTANLIDVSISIANKAGDVAAAEDFAAVEDAEFSVEEGTNVLDATQIYCVSNDLSIELGGSGDYVTSIGGLTEKDGADTTGWIFMVNGEAGSLGADEVVLEEDDKISWEFVDFATYSW